MLFLLLVLSYYKGAGKLLTLTIYLEELKMKTVILILACLLLAIPCQAAEKAYSAGAAAKAVKLTHEQQIQHRLKIQEQRLEDIEELVSKERQVIEAWYAFRLTELRQLAQRKAKQLILSQRMLWTEFIKMNSQIPFGDTYFSNTARTFVSDTKAFELRDAMMDSYFLGTAANLLLDSKFSKLLTDLSNGSGYNPQNLIIRSEARKLLRLAKEFESELMRLENRRNDKLAALEQWEKGLREHVFKVMRDIKAQPKTPELGVVSAISYDEKGSLCMVDGVDRVLQPGDKINNVTVVKIQKDRVEFAKGGRMWVQKIGEPAKPAWK